MTHPEFDLFVIGGGSGGVRAARMAAARGARVALAESAAMGGTCVNLGCIPKKLYSYAAHFSDSFQEARGFGWTLGATTFDWETLKTNRAREILRLNGIYENLLAKVHVVRGRATLVDANTVAVGAEEFKAKRILVATGGWPQVPDVPGREHVVTSNEIFDLPTFPKRLVVVGGGYIASEFASIFNGLGSNVVQLYRGEQILRGFDHDVRAHLASEMKKKGIDIRLGEDVEKIERSGDRVRVSLTNGKAFGAGEIMFATGRVPNIAGLGLAKAGVHVTPHGAIGVDAYSRTNIANIYAVGDVTNRLNLTPVAIREGHAFADTLFGGKDVKVDHAMVPTAVFSQPEIGTVGMTEEAARKAHAKVVIFKTAFRPMKHTLSGRDERMLM